LLKNIGIALPNAVNDLGAGLTLRRYQLQATWAFVVGRALAFQSEPTSIKGDTLFVRTSTSIWSQELLFRWNEILPKLRKVLPEANILKIRCRVARLSRDPLPSSRHDPDPEGVDWDSIPLAPQVVKKVEAIAGAVEDPELRASIKRALLQIERRRVWSYRNGMRPCLTCGDFQNQAICTSCELERLRERQQKIFQLLGRRAWSTLRDLQEFIPDLNVREYSTARRKLGSIFEASYRYSREALPIGQPFPVPLREIITDLVMMTTGINPENLQERHFLHTLGKVWGNAFLANVVPDIVAVTAEAKARKAKKAKRLKTSESLPEQPSGQPRPPGKAPSKGRRASRLPDEAYRAEVGRRWDGWKKRTPPLD
jgi:hypothetical protein